MNLRGLVKPLVDTAVARLQRVERSLHGSRGDVVLDGFERLVQLDQYSCGAQVTFAVLKYFGRARSVARTTALLGTDEDGTAWPAMRRLFRQRGLATRAIGNARRRDIKHAIDNGAPVIVSVDDAHWASVFGYGSTHVFLADPSLLRSPRVVVPWSSFARRWDRWAAVVSRTPRVRMSST